MATNEVLKKARKKAGYTLDDMSQMLGYKSKVTYYYIESNKSKVTLETASRIAEILNKPMEELFPIFFKHGVQETQTHAHATGTTG